MMTNKAIYDFLTKDENLQFAIELCDELDQFQTEMHKLFWTKYNELMATKLADSGFGNDWWFEPYNLRRLNRGWEKSWLTPNIDDTKRLVIYIAFLQESRDTNFRLSYSLHWNKRNSEVNFDSPTLLKLKAMLASYKINIPGEWEIMWGFSQWRVFDVDFLLGIYKNTDVFCQTIVDYNWKMFLELRPLMETINQEVAHIKK